MILLIDNYDSFSYNLYQLIGQINTDIKTVRNDKITIEEIIDLNPEAIVLSPGPGRPEDAGICVSLVKELKGKYPILGVCLGHQAICTAYGAIVDHALTLMHGKKSLAHLNDISVFKGIKTPLSVARYHSLAVIEETLPPNLIVSAKVIETNEVMAVEDVENRVVGLQFHPESILSECGIDIIKNFLIGDKL
ncbi:MAG: aminodeoxychorismate/anthranilate synthase component II [Spirochaetia bacterium]|nr:aminodeoxychorismate/anthranilate synthase component II [Spirochaetia bacterium]